MRKKLYVSSPTFFFFVQWCYYQFNIWFPTNISSFMFIPHSNHSIKLSLNFNFFPNFIFTPSVKVLVAICMRVFGYIYQIMNLNQHYVALICYYEMLNVETEYSPIYWAWKLLVLSIICCLLSTFINLIGNQTINVKSNHLNRKTTKDKKWTLSFWLHKDFACICILDGAKQLQARVVWIMGKVRNYYGSSQWLWFAFFWNPWKNWALQLPHRRPVTMPWSSWKKLRK